MANKKPANPLLGASNFKIEDSFGPQPALLAPSGPFQTTTSKPGPPPVMKPPVDIGPPPVSLPPPQPGLFLLPTSTPGGGGVGPPPPMNIPSGSKPRSRYVPPPGIHSSSSSGNLSSVNNSFPDGSNIPFGIPPTLPPLTSPPSAAMMMIPSPAPPAPTMMANSASVPDFVNIRGGPELYPGQHEKMEAVVANTNVCEEPVYHWYFKVHEKSYNVLNPT